jgi:hypothetical protein
MCLCGSKKVKHIDTIVHIGSHIEKNFYALSHQNNRDKSCLCGSKKNKHIATIVHIGSHIEKEDVPSVVQKKVQNFPFSNNNSSPANNHLPLIY